MVEGVDGSGKSTVAHLLAERVSGYVVESPPAPFRQIRAEIEGADPFSRLFFYLAGNLRVSRMVLESRNPRVIVVRHFWSTIAYFCAREQMAVSDVLNIASGARNLLWLPEKVIYLGVNRGVQRLRLAERMSESTLQRSLIADSALQDRILSAYDEVLALTGADVLRLDSSATQAPTLVARIVEALTTD